jgi:hypothetical protein
MDEFEVAEISIIDPVWRHGERTEEHRYLFGKVLPGTGLGYVLDGSDWGKRYYPLHLASSYGIVGWFKSEQAAQGFVRRIAPLADWTGEIDWHNEALAQRITAIFHEVESGNV